MPRSRYSRFRDQVQISGVSMAVPQTGKVFYVSNNPTLTEFGISGSDGNNGRTPEQPFATINYAITQCKARRGDVIFVMEGHAETISAAAGIALNIAGVSVVGMGIGAERPTITFSATASTWTISAASCLVSNIVVTPSIDSVVTAFVVSAADVVLDIESQDASSSIEFVGVVTTTAAADRFTCKLKHRGFTSGDAGVRTIVLVGCDGGDIDVDFYGIASTAVVGFVTTASTNINIKGIFNNGSTALTKNVVDTITGSKWEVTGYDVVGGYEFRGGSGTAVYPVFINSVDNAANILGANNADNAFDSSAVVANSTGSMLERIAALQSTAAGSLAETAVKKATATLPASGNQTIFTVTGGPIEILDILGEVTTVIQTQACNLKITSVDTASSTATDICANLNITAAAVGTFFNITGTLANALVATAGGTAISQAGRVVIPAGVLRITTSATNTGSVAWYIRYRPLSTGVSVA